MMPVECLDTPRRKHRAVAAKRAPIASALLLALSSSLCAGASNEMSEAEYWLLPEYCRAQSNVSEMNFRKFHRADLAAKWQAALGRNYDHYHHFCWGIVSIARAYKQGSQYGSRGALANSAVADITYMIERATPDFILLPEVYTKLGEAYLLARDDRNAESAFRKAREIKPDYWRPYVWWAQRLIQLGRTREALALAEEGQKNAPDAKAINDLVRELRGERGSGKR